VHQQKPAEGEIDFLRQAEVLSLLGDREHLRLTSSGSRRGDGVSRPWIAVDGIDATGPTDEPCEGDGDVSGARADVDARPSRAETKTVQSCCKRAAIDVISKTKFGHVVRVQRLGHRSPPRAARYGFAMRATMLLCDSAQVADGKLYILGGGWSLIGPDPAPTAVALKIDVDWTEVDRPHHWELFLVDEDGQPVLAETQEGTQPIEVRGDFEVARPAEIAEGTPVGVALALNFGPLPLLAGGRFAWRLMIDGAAQDDWSLSFSTRSSAPT
jgi:hypothetical protein